MADRFLVTRLKAVAAMLLLTAALAAGCAGPTPYQARGADAGYGYQDRQLAADRYRVTVSGNEQTSRETVEAHLLYRAAELTAAAGAPAFEVLEREVEPRTRYITTYLTGYPFQAPQDHEFYGSRLGEVHGSPDGGTRAMASYRATAEIRLLTRLPDQAGSGVYEAQRVLNELAPRIGQASAR